MEDNAVKGAHPTTEGEHMNEEDWFPVTNRKTRRHCKHLFKKISARTACIYCGQDA